MYPEAFEIEACRRFGTQKLVGERFKKHKNTASEKYAHIVHKVIVLCFLGLGPKAAQGGSKDLPRAFKVSPKVPKWSPTAIPNQ